MTTIQRFSRDCLTSVAKAGSQVYIQECGQYQLSDQLSDQQRWILHPNGWLSLASDESFCLTAYSDTPALENPLYLDICGRFNGQHWKKLKVASSPDLYQLQLIPGTAPPVYVQSCLSLQGDSSSGQRAAADACGSHVFFDGTSGVYTTPSPNVTDRLQSICSNLPQQYRGSFCPWSVSYDIATHLLKNLARDGFNGIWADTKHDAGNWWEAGLGFWTFSDWLTVFPLGGGSPITDLGYFALRMAAEQTSAATNNSMVTNSYDDQAWWGNGYCQLELYSRIRGYQGQGENACDAVIKDNLSPDALSHTTGCEFGGLYGVVWNKPGGSIGNTVITTLLTMVMLLLKNKLQSSPELVSQAISFYTWLKLGSKFECCQANQSKLAHSSDLADPLTGKYADNVNPYNCKTPEYHEYSYVSGMLILSLVELSKATGNQSYLQDAGVFASYGITKFVKGHIYYDECFNDSCDQQQYVFKAAFFQGLSSYYMETKDPAIRHFLLKTYRTMVDLVKPLAQLMFHD
ncbi:hypothetical protein BC830DRAFT_948727 [Chytriomyces sp. MP71]|nr:hypothetical protein BC830DRAFT_948727 [Chytriomyces sp. MP71]